MNIKKYLITILCLIVSITCFFAVACDNKKVELVGFEKTGKATATLGSIYKINDLSIKDVEGNVYYYDISVKDSKGNKVVCIGGEFEVLDAEGYTINYSLEITSKDIRERTVTVTVEDKTQPKISVSLKTGFVNEEYIIPKITVSDLSGESIMPTYTVYKKNDETKTPILLNNGKFVPTESGSYILSITAKDSSNNTANVEKEFGIRNQANENILENFDDPSSLVNSLNGSNNQEWLESFEGRNGVLHINGTDSEKTGYLFRFMRDREAYKHTPFKSITVSLFVTKYADLYQSTTDGSKSTDWFGAQKNTWIDFTITDFMDWQYLFNGATSDKGGQLFWSWTKNTEIYIDEIRFSAKPNVEFTTDAVNNKVEQNSEVSVSATVPTDDRLVPYISVKSPSGKNVRVVNGKFTATEMGKYTVTATVETSEWSYYDTTATLEIISLNSYIKVGEDYKDEDIGSVYVLGDCHELNTPFVLPTAIIYNPITDEEISGEISTSVKFNGQDVSISDGKFTPTTEGIYNVTYTSGTDYVTECIVYVLKVELADNELENYSRSDSAKLAKYGLDGQASGKEPEWLPLFEGRTGVIKLNDNASESGYMLRINKSYEEVSSIVWDFIDIDVYITAGSWLCYGNNVDSSMPAINTSTPWAIKQWTTISISKSKIENPDNFLKALTGNTGAHIFWGWDLSENVYIDKICFRANSNVLNDFSLSTSSNECLNGINGVGSSATWLETYQGANGVIKANDGGAMGGFYLRTNAISDVDLASRTWDYIEVKLWATNSSWTMFYDQDLVFEIKGGEWSTLRISKTAIENQMPLSSFCKLLTSSNGAQLFWTWDNLGDVYFDSIKLV